MTVPPLLPGLHLALDREGWLSGQAQGARLARRRYARDGYTVAEARAPGLSLRQVCVGKRGEARAPVITSDGLGIVAFDGHLRNAAQLAGRPVSHSEVPSLVAELFVAEGWRVVRDFKGAFNAIWIDSTDGSATLVTDRFGVYRLVHHWDGRHVWRVGPNGLRLQRSLGGSWRLDPQALAEYLTFGYVLGDRSLLSDLRVVPPASCLRLDANGLSVQPYWRLTEIVPRDDLTWAQASEALQAALMAALHECTPRGWRPAVSLSGGLDSRVITFGLADQGLRPYTYTFGARGCLDSSLAPRVARACGLDYRFYPLRAEDLRKYDEDLVLLTDGQLPIVHGHGAHCMEAVARQADIVVHGLSGDMIMGSFLDEEVVEAGPADLASILYHRANTGLDWKTLGRLLGPAVAGQLEASPREVFEAAVREFQPNHAANVADFVNLRQRQRRFIFEAMRMLRRYMEHAAPFYDYDLVSLVMSLPAHMRVKEGLYQDAIGKLYPPAGRIPQTRTGLPLSPTWVDRVRRWFRNLFMGGSYWLAATTKNRIPPPALQGIAPYGLWLRHDLREYLQWELLSDRAFPHDYLVQGEVTRLVQAHAKGAEDHTLAIGALLSVVTLWRSLAELR
jgi:asparagine synthase (glutamine-hydrolysing)